MSDPVCTYPKCQTTATGIKIADWCKGHCGRLDSLGSPKFGKSLANFTDAEIAAEYHRRVH